MTTITIILGLWLAALYMVPTIIAVTGKHKYWKEEAMYNINYGWTIVGWYRALIRAADDEADRALYLERRREAAHVRLSEIMFIRFCKSNMEKGLVK